MLEAWLREANVDLDGRLSELRHLDPDLARTIARRVAALERIGWVDQVEPRAPRPGDTFGNYELQSVLGSGGMGVVYRARHRANDRLVALKVLRGERLFDSRVRERFHNEVRAIRQLRHPGICAVLDAGEIAGVPFFAMALIEGESLAAILGDSRRRGRVALGRREIRAITRAIEAIARALHAAHEVGIVHRDLKPGNVMIDRNGHAVLIDFGLAMADAESARARDARGDERVGTPAYMSPEQVHPDHTRVDRRSDIYSLGATLFECLTLHRPFESNAEIDLDARVARALPPDPRRLVPELRPALCAVVARAMATAPAERHPTALAFADDLARAVPVPEDGEESLRSVLSSFVSRGPR